MSEDKKNKKIFDEYQHVDCNECSRYWDNSCDGINSKCKIDSKGSKRLCNSYLPTRSVVIPEQIKVLQNEVKWLVRCTYVLGAAVVWLLMSNLLW